MGDHGANQLQPAHALAIPAAAERHAGNRLLLVLLFWVGLAASMAVWAFNTPSGTITGRAAAMLALARVTGLASGYLLLALVLLASRVSWLEQGLGSHDLLRWHRQLGAYLLIAVIAHTMFTIYGYALTAGVSLVTQTGALVTAYDDLIAAFLATGLLAALSLVAVRAVRRRMRYEVWRLTHLGMYLVVLLGYGHQFSIGADLFLDGFGQWYWVCLHLFVLSCLVWGRLVEPAWLNLRHQFRVARVQPEGDEVFSIYLTGHHLDLLDGRAGQYYRWRFLNHDGWWQSHPFSLSAAPNDHWLRLTVRVAGDHTDDLRYLEPGTRVLAAGPYGVFTADRQTRPLALLIAGGSGIAPIRALLEDLPVGTILLYRASSAADVVFRHELDMLARIMDAQVRYILGDRRDPGPRRLFTPAGLRELVPDVMQRDVYLCGPPGMITAARKTLRRLRVPAAQIHLDPFEF